jgi:hypothetical protein
MNNVATVVPDKPPIRPLSVLVGLIQQDLTSGAEAAKQAAMPYYRAAGEKMIEAKAQLPNGEFIPWVERNFGIKGRQASEYMSLARTTANMQNGGAPLEFSSIREHERFLGRNRPTGGAVRRDWQPDVDKAAARAREEMERTQDERKAEQQLAIRLIDIGYKVLAKELHPDKGGSREAMARLSRVRDRLKHSA